MGTHSTTDFVFDLSDSDLDSVAAGFTFGGFGGFGGFAFRGMFGGAFNGMFDGIFQRSAFVQMREQSQSNSGVGNGFTQTNVQQAERFNSYSTF